MENVIITNSEAIYDTWNSEIFDLYAASEFLYMGIRKPDKDDYKVYMDLNLIEVLDEDLKMVKTGERGRVLKTSLVNKTLPFIRYDMLDYATLGNKNFGLEPYKVWMEGRMMDSQSQPWMGVAMKFRFTVNGINIPEA